MIVKVSILTPREAQCLGSIAEGKTLAAVARELALSVPTVALHLKNTRKKLTALNNEHAIALAFRAGLLK